MDDQATAYTYEQAATALGIQAEAVRARLRRGALRRGPRANDGRPTVLLSPDDIATLRASVRPERLEISPDSGPDSAARPDGRDISALAELFQALTERAEREAAVLRENETRERERAEAAERRLEEERLRAAAEATELRAAGEAARLQAARAEATAEGLRLALEEARRPFWRRWIG
jgi:hypothetical protein